MFVTPGTIIRRQTQNCGHVVILASCALSAAASVPESSIWRNGGLVTAVSTPDDQGHKHTPLIQQVLWEPCVALVLTLPFAGGIEQTTDNQILFDMFPCRGSRVAGRPP